MFPDAPRDRHRRSSTVAFAGCCALFAAAPFERLTPLVVLPAQRLSNVEVVLVAALAVWAGALAVLHERPEWRTPITWPGVLCLAIAALAAAFAPAFQLNAWKVTARLATAFLVLLLTVNGVTSLRRLRVLMYVASSAGAVVAAAALLEYIGVPAIRQWLEAFRDGVYVAGGQVRASGTLQYPTIASMFLEIVFALTAGVFLWAVDRHRPGLEALLFVALALVAEGVVVTLTRGGFAGLAVVLACVAGLRLARRGLDRGVTSLGTLAAVIALLMISSVSAESLWLRLTTEARTGWYRAAFLTPATLRLTPGAQTPVHVTVVNEGRASWPADSRPAFHVSYHWFDESGSRIVSYDGLRSPLPRSVAPGESVRMDVDVLAPDRPGQYTIGWDLVQEGRVWFSAEPGARMALSKVAVSHDPAAAPAAGLPSRPAAPPGPIGRVLLWAAALRIFVASPVLGIGPDNFRLSYGRVLGRDDADDRVTSNNTCLEVLTGSGIAGFGAFGWLLWRLQGALRSAAKRMDGAAASLYSGVVAAAVVMTLHGLVDSFLTLTPTYVAMATALGAGLAPLTWRETAADAHRV